MIAHGTDACRVLSMEGTEQRTASDGCTFVNRLVYSQARCGCVAGILATGAFFHVSLQTYAFGCGGVEAGHCRLWLVVDREPVRTVCALCFLCDTRCLSD